MTKRQSDYEVEARVFLEGEGEVFVVANRRATHTGHSAHAKSSSACKMRTAQLVALAQEQI